MRTAAAIILTLLAGEAAAAGNGMQVCFEGQNCPDLTPIVNDIRNQAMTNMGVSMSALAASVTAAMGSSFTLPTNISLTALDASSTLRGNNATVADTLTAPTVSGTGLLRMVSSSLPTCNAAQAGTIRRSTNKACYCDGGGTWRNIAPAGLLVVLGVNVVVADNCP